MTFHVFERIIAIKSEIIIVLKLMTSTIICIVLFCAGFYIQLKREIL